MTRRTPGSASAGPGVLLCLPTGGAVSPSDALWGCGWYPHMGGVLKGAQIGSCGLSCAGVCARAHIRARARACE
uniref:Uncharacterized protein n=1 Tax=Siphoviridae sp. ctRGj11 TaxID=2827868 RepID=A0A8S5SK18_9CAUD|nr:MAG TPA: hypothetical protein [Siphoviridae sp. ctRGj11]